MFNLGANPKVRGSGHIVLNVLRAFNLIGLLGGIFASVAFIVVSGLKLDVWFFDIMAHLFIFSLCVFLFISELGLFKGYFERNWPVFTQDHSLFWLGMSMIVMGTEVLSNLDKPKYTVGGMGLPLFRGIYASGVLAIVFGGFNIIASLIYRDRSSGITARHIRSDGNLATPPTKDGFDSFSLRSPENFSQTQTYEEEPSRFRRFTKHFNFSRGVKKTEISSPLPVHQPAIDEDYPSHSALPVQHPAIDADYVSYYTRKGSEAGDEESRPGFPKPPSLCRHPANRQTTYSTANMSEF